MQGRMLTVLGAMSALLLAAPAAVQGAPKVKDPKLVTVDNPFVSCVLPLPTGKVEVASGNTVQFASDFPDPLRDPEVREERRRHGRDVRRLLGRGHAVKGGRVLRRLGLPRRRRRGRDLTHRRCETAV